MLLPVRRLHDRRYRRPRRRPQHRDNAGVFGFRAVWQLSEKPVPTAQEALVFGPFAPIIGEWPWVSILAWSWDPLKVKRRHPPHHLSPAQANHPAGQVPRSASATPSHHSNAPIRPECQSFLSNIVPLNRAKRGYWRFRPGLRRVVARILYHQFESYSFRQIKLIILMFFLLVAFRLRWRLRHVHRRH